MNPLPESAVELAARAVAVAEDWTGWDTGSATPNGNTVDEQREWCRHVARLALTAALPAIREAVVGELAGLVEKWRQTAKHHDAKADRPFLDDASRNYHHGLAESCENCADDLAALTEQENRNDQERSHDGG